MTVRASSRRQIAFAQIQRVQASFDERHVRNPYAVPLFAFWVAVCIVLVSTIAPDSRADATPVITPGSTLSTQLFEADGTWSHSIQRDSYDAVAKPKPAVAPSAGVPDPGTAKAIAWELLQLHGWGEAEYDCLVALWTRESGWNHLAENKSSGAYGIPQALPGSKMATVADDWRTNPHTQIVWGLSYIEGRYGTPCGAWAAFLSKGWY
ncbi:MAG TPA: lytic transglycosylase domain-containing protein [Terrimesophilobacter sp.]|nr:lytic transglycosylase domain-containing protein [Terrimesophilobacter sp.]HRP99541.1 lytic transglycosylase domain-containing protein [Terrimesophilobacter sp.]